MQDKSLIEQVGDKIINSRHSSQHQSDGPAKLSSAQKQVLTNAINQLFAEMELTYHNQFHKAFPNEEKLTYAKKLWFDYLKEFSPQRILLACRKATRESDFLPTVHSIIKHCESSTDELGLPDSHSAYIEACQAPSPKADYAWSHPAVYWAGKASDWFFLASNIESKAFPIFKRNYDIICERVKNGDQLEPPVPLALPETSSPTLTKQQRQAELQKIREQFHW